MEFRELQTRQLSDVCLESLDTKAATCPANFVSERFRDVNKNTNEEKVEKSRRDVSGLVRLFLILMKNRFLTENVR